MANSQRAGKCVARTRTPPIGLCTPSARGLSANLSNRQPSQVERCLAAVEAAKQAGAFALGLPVQCRCALHLDLRRSRVKVPVDNRNR
jgi:hypothetical protein